MTISAISNVRDVKTNLSNGDKALRVIVDQDGNPIPVEFDEAGISINVYDEALSVAASATATIVTYTVPALKEFRLKRVDFSGNNRGVYSIEINTVVEAKKRTYYTSYNDCFVFEDLPLNAGDTLELIVENKSSTMTGNFNANIQGNLRDA